MSNYIIFKSLMYAALKLESEKEKKNASMKKYKIKYLCVINYAFTIQHNSQSSM